MSEKAVTLEEAIKSFNQFDVLNDRLQEEELPTNVEDSNKKQPNSIKEWVKMCLNNQKVVFLQPKIISNLKVPPRNKRVSQLKTHSIRRKVVVTGVIEWRIRKRTTWKIEKFSLCSRM